jgi:hypothetical protein
MLPGLRPCRVRGFHPLQPAIPGRSATISGPYSSPTTPRGYPHGLGWSAFARRYLRNRFCFLFLQVMRCFSSLGWLGYSGIITRLAAPPDLSQSSTPYSLLVPRHPPHALSSLATLFSPSPRVTTKLRLKPCESYLPGHPQAGRPKTIIVLILRLVSNVKSIPLGAYL